MLKILAWIESYYIRGSIFGLGYLDHMTYIMIYHDIDLRLVMSYDISSLYHDIYDGVEKMVKIYHDIRLATLVHCALDATVTTMLSHPLGAQGIMITIYIIVNFRC